MEYRKAVEIADVAEDLIFDYHEELREHGPRIEYLMTRSSSKSGRGPAYKIRKITGLHAFLATNPLPETFGPGSLERDFVVIEVNDLWWALLGSEQRKGFMDHLLCHLTYDADKAKWTIEPPEYGEFPEVLDRHGFWHPSDSFKDFATTVGEQLSLLPDEERERLAVPAEIRAEIKRGGVLRAAAQLMADRHAEELGEGSMEIFVDGVRIEAQTGEVLQDTLQEETAEPQPAGVASE